MVLSPNEDVKQRTVTISGKDRYSRVHHSPALASILIDSPTDIPSRLYNPNEIIISKPFTSRRRVPDTDGLSRISTEFVTVGAASLSRPGTDLAGTTSMCFVAANDLFHHDP